MKKNIGLLTVAIAGVMMLNPAFAAGLDQVNELLENIKSVLTGAALVSVTIAIMWAGYKYLFGGSTIREVAPILIGGIVIGAALQIATLLVGHLGS